MSEISLVEPADPAISRVQKTGTTSPIPFDDMLGFTLSLTAIARASFASALTIQCLRASRATTPWQVGAGTVAGEATLLTGIGFMDGC
jgi:hypothetical protein